MKPSIETIYNWLDAVKDPEVPVLSVTDLGIVRSVQWEDDRVVVTITPTYSGCPAMDVIAMEIRMLLLEKDLPNHEIRRQLSPAWTTDWISQKGREELKAFGIAPPHHTQSVCTPEAFQEEEAVQCPRCNSYHTTLVSRFGSTACKALYKCEDCREPFDYFKCH